MSRARRNTEDDERTSADVEAVQNQPQNVSCSVDHNMHDGRDHLEGRVRSPSTKSWNSEDEDLSPRASRYYTSLYTTDGCEQLADCNNTSIRPSTPRTVETRKASTVTVFPTFRPLVKNSDLESERIDADVEQHKPVDGENGRAKGQSYIKRLKEIYRAGPPDEGQRLWRGLRNYWREKQTGVVFEMCAPYRRDEASHVPSSESVVDREATDSPRHQSPIETSHIVGEDVEQCRPRRDSVVSYGDVSRTSREVPVKICQTILTLDANKPPPPPPRLSDAPRRRSQRTQNEIVDLDKPLPRTPFPCFPEPPKPWETSRESPVVPPWPPIHTATVGSELPDHYEEAPRQGNSTSSKRSKDVVQGPQPSTWLKNLATKVPNPQLNSPSKSKPTKADKAHDALKAKISRPIPISPTTIAVDFSPHRLPPQPDTMSEKARGKQRAPSSPTWLDKLAHAPLPILHTMPAMLQAKKRPGSDKSFQCQGTVAGHVCEECAPDLETGGRRGRQRARHGDGMRPEPLFTGGMFDGSYCDVEDANADHIRTGRWI